MPDEEVSPGQLLHEHLQTLFPYRLGSDSFIGTIDSALLADQELARHVYLSTIAYLTRRLIRTAQFLRRRYDPDGSDPSIYLRELRRYLKSQMKVDRSAIEKLHSLVNDAELAAGRSLSTARASQKRDQAVKSRETTCYMCGCSLDFSTEGNDDSAEVEHVWPRSLGGLNELSNLRMACRRCNKAKESAIDAADFHFEWLCLQTGDSDESFSNELGRRGELAVWAKAEFACVRCGEAAQDVGRLKLTRRNRDDSWHFLNLDAICERHAR